MRLAKVPLTGHRIWDLLEIGAGSLVAVGDGVEGLRDLARPSVALYVGGMGARGHNFYNSLVQRYGFEAEAARIETCTSPATSRRRPQFPTNCWKRPR